MKIAIDARELRGTGTGRYLEWLLHYLQQLDNTHDYIVLLTPKDMASWKPTNPRFSKVACPFKEFTFGEQFGFWRQLKRLRVDLVHFPIVQQPIFYRGKVVTTMNDLSTVRFRNPAKNWVIFTIKRWVYKRVNKIVARKSQTLITYSEFVKADVSNFANIDSQKITVIPLAADKISEPAETMQLLEGKPFIMYVGRSLPHKNLERLIQAFALLKQNHPELTLVLAGKLDANYRRLEQFATKLGAHDVFFADFVTDGELRWLYEHAKAYVFPSLSEGFGLPGLEAMAHGCPLASSNATCLPEVYKDAVVYFDPLDVTAMAEAVAQLLDDPKLAHRLVIKGSVLVKDYSWQRMANQTLAVYKKTLGERAAHSSSGD